MSRTAFNVLSRFILLRQTQFEWKIQFTTKMFVKTFGSVTQNNKIERLKGKPQKKVKQEPPFLITSNVGCQPSGENPMKNKTVCKSSTHRFRFDANKGSFIIIETYILRTSFF